MRSFMSLAATLSLSAASLLSGAVSAQELSQGAEQATPPAQPAKEATKSRSNIQNNRVAPAAPAAEDPAAGTEPTDVLKTKTKSNQSND